MTIITIALLALLAPGITLILLAVMERRALEAAARVAYPKLVVGTPYETGGSQKSARRRAKNRRRALRAIAGDPAGQPMFV